MAANHETVVNLAQVEMTRQGARLFKNPMGQGFAGKVCEDYQSSAGHVVSLLGAARVRFGVCNPGGSDLIGWRPVEITEDMVGKTLALFVAVECKTPAYNRASKDQKNFLGQLAQAGGEALIARRDKDGRLIFEAVDG